MEISITGVDVSGKLRALRTFAGDAANPGTPRLEGCVDD